MLDIIVNLQGGFAVYVTAGSAKMHIFEFLFSKYL